MKLRKGFVPGIGPCFANPAEHLATLTAVHRLEMLRDYIFNAFGAGVFMSGVTPGLGGADGLFYVERLDSWMRVWCDLGGCAPEALKFIRKRPAVFAENLQDAILTVSPDRIPLIAAQIEGAWKSRGETFVFCTRSNRYQSISEGNRRSGRIARQEWLYSMVITASDERRAWNRRLLLLGKLFQSLDQDDFSLLIFVGNNPLLAKDEIAFLVASSGHESFEALLQRIRLLEQMELIEEVYLPGAKDRKSRVVLSSRGLKLLQAYWGVEPEDMRRFHPWPQKREGKTRQVRYSVKGLKRINEHTREVREFSLALIDGAKRVSFDHGGVDVSLDTMIGSRLLYRENAQSANWVVPDAVLSASFWTRTWADGQIDRRKHVPATYLLFLELDRATNPITRLADRIRKYGGIWWSLPGRPALIWVINGTPHRESEILAMMEKYRIEGWTVLRERLVIAPENDWWTSHQTSGFHLPLELVGCMSPWRKIWRKPGDFDHHHFLDRAPWSREIARRTRDDCPTPKVYS
jgi:hypothetical protein